MVSDYKIERDYGEGRHLIVSYPSFSDPNLTPRLPVVEPRHPGSQEM